MFSSNCCFLICIQVSQEAENVWYSHLFENFSQFVVIHTVKGFGIGNKAEIYVFLELSCFFDDPMDVSDLISGSSAFSKSNLNIWKFTVHVLLKPGLENFEDYFTSLWDECNCVVVWAFFSIAFLWDWNENWPFSVLWPRLSFPYWMAYWVQHFQSIIFHDLKELSWNSIISTSFVHIDDPLQCSCLENPRDWGAWWAAIYGVTQSRTQLKWLNWTELKLYRSPSPLSFSCLTTNVHSRG